MTAPDSQKCKPLPRRRTQEISVMNRRTEPIAHMGTVSAWATKPAYTPAVTDECYDVSGLGVPWLRWVV
jgi:hypothetical protein